jgi:hypothetical protein
MTFLWIDNGGLPRRVARQRFERRIDEHTAGDIADALRARGSQAAALAMEYLHVDMDLALRVLNGARKRRSVMQDAVQAAYGRRRRARAEAGAQDALAPALTGA